MAEFETAVKEADPDEGKLEFTLIHHFKKDVEPAKRVIHVYPPDPGQFAMLMASVGRGAKEQDRIAGLVNFFIRVLDDEDAHHIEARMFDRNDPFGMEEVEKIMEWMVEEWSGRPTQSLSVSTRSPESDGQNSTRSTSESTSSGSLLTDS